ncbi:TPA: lysostaphin resistance A-like protein [Streptococcus pneumoniae]|nr:CPBP family intramembrane metalloprotease [Streptococcus pneumoniae]HEV9443188.1 CPBP family intramembrane metalloprotease [Streptococcus pneumoniae]
MKKIISHRYFIIVFLLVIADQKFSVLVLRSDLVTGLSDFAYYLSDMMLNFLVVLFALIAMIWSGKWQKINSRKFKGSYLFYPVIAGPIFEEIIHRGLVMTVLEKGKKWGLDVLGSAVLFGVSHISNHGWVLTDFVFYMGGGLIFAVLFRMTKSIYWPIGLHIVYNGIGQLLMLL